MEKGGHDQISWNKSIPCSSSCDYFGGSQGVTIPKGWPQIFGLFKRSLETWDLDFRWNSQPNDEQSNGRCYREDWPHWWFYDQLGQSASDLSDLSDLWQQGISDIYGCNSPSRISSKNGTLIMKKGPDDQAPGRVSTKSWALRTMSIQFFGIWRISSLTRKIFQDGNIRNISKSLETTSPKYAWNVPGFADNVGLVSVLDSLSGGTGEPSCRVYIILLQWCVPRSTILVHSP